MYPQILISSFLVVNQINLFPILLLKLLTTQALGEDVRSGYYDPPRDERLNSYNYYNYENPYLQHYYYQPPWLTENTQDHALEDRRIEVGSSGNYDEFPKSRHKSHKKNRKKFDMESVNSFMNQVPYFYPAMETTLAKPDPEVSSDLSSQGYFPPYYYPDLATPIPSMMFPENGTATGLGFPWSFDSLFGWHQFDSNNETDVDSTTTELPVTTEVPTTTEVSNTTELDLDMTTTMSPEEEEEETTTLPPFTIKDVKVPIPFLRIEYMISFTFFGLMYGLGFFVLFQSLCVPAAKYAVTIVYLILLKLKAIDPVTLEQALSQLPPT